MRVTDAAHWFNGVGGPGALGSVVQPAKPAGKVGLCPVGDGAPCLSGDRSWPEGPSMDDTPPLPVCGKAVMQLTCLVHLVDAVEVVDVGQQHRRLHH